MLHIGAAHERTYVDQEIDRAWMRKGNCNGVDPATFFPERGQTTREAKAICDGCSVKARCLDYAIVHEESWGVWGGTSEQDRRNMRRKRPNGRSLPLWEDDQYEESL